MNGQLLGVKEFTESFCFKKAICDHLFLTNKIELTRG